MKNYIYLIKKENESVYKIGKSKTPYKRIKQLSTANESNLKMVNIFEAGSNTSKVEKALHNKYKQYNLNGEWYSLSIEYVNSFNKDCQTILDNIKLLQRDIYYL